MVSDGNQGDIAIDNLLITEDTNECEGNFVVFCLLDKVWRGSENFSFNSANVSVVHLLLYMSCNHGYKIFCIYHAESCTLIERCCNMILNLTTFKVSNEFCDAL